MTKELTPFKGTPEGDCIEPELIDNGPGSGGGRREPGPGGGRREPGPGGRERDGGAPRPQRKTGPIYALFARLKAVFITGLLLLSFGLIFLGAVLTSTLIGAVIGIPLILLGFVPLWLLLRLLSRGGKSGTVIFRRF